MEPRDISFTNDSILSVVVDATNVVEQPDLFASRIMNFGKLVGRENVIAGTDCGLGCRVHAQIARAKLDALAEGERPLENCGARRQVGSCKVVVGK